MDETSTSEAGRLAAALVRRASEPEACAGLAGVLADRATLDRLDPRAAREAQSPVQWRLHRIVTALAANPSAAASREFDALCGAADFTADPGRSEILLRAIDAGAPLGACAIALVRAQAVPGSVNLQLAVIALWHNRSAAALDLLGEILTDPRHDDIYVTAWMRMGFVPWRGEAPVVGLAAQLLAPGRLTPARRLKLVESLYDYQPDRWFTPHESTLRPPEPGEMQAEAKEQLVALARQVLAEGTLPPALREAVGKTGSSLEPDGSRR